MAQGWTIDTASGGSITFYEAPAPGASISVSQYPIGGRGGSDVWALGAWSPFHGYPREVEFYGDRLFFASTPKDPQAIWGSCVGDYVNFGRSSPIIDSDAVSFVLNSRQVNTIKDLIPLDNLLVMTTGGEYKMTGGANDVVTPSTIGLKNQGNSGSGDVQSRIIGETAIFVQDEGQKIRDLGYQFEKDGFRGNEISVWGSHLFEGYEVQNIEYWKSPWSVLWFTRDDGIRVGITYMPEQEVIGNHWHDTDGEYLDTCALPGKKESECYYLVRRYVDGEVVQYLEQQAPSRYENEDDLFYVDSGLTYDGRNLTATTVTLTTSTGWTEDDELTLTSSTPIFEGASDVGDALMIRRTVSDVDSEGNAIEVEHRVRFFIDAFMSPTQVTGRSVGEVNETLRNVASSDWTFQRDTFGGLWHLEGKSVNVLQDAAVAGPYTVENGQITLQDPGGVVHIGLGYSMEVETLELNEAGAAPLRDQNKLAYAVSILVLGTRGVKAGGIRDKLYPVPSRSFEDYGQPPYLKNGVVSALIPAGWGDDAGRVRIVSDDPLPCEILNITTKAANSPKTGGGGGSGGGNG